MILVTGAAGKTGLPIITHLAELGEPIRALVHREEQISLVESAGAQDSVTGDIHDSKFLAKQYPGFGRFTTFARQRTLKKRPSAKH